jgi:hypothetical protein
MGLPYTALLGSHIEESTVVALSGGALELPLLLDDRLPHCFVAVEFYSDANGATPVTASAGTITFTLTLPVQPNAQQPFTGNVVNAADNDVTSWAANASAVNASITGITGSPTHARVRVHCNAS